ncbi:hypothetical protein BDA99DRAFT_559476 [Phascolomyces articulosus]|uniref:Myb-like domain-containing protein n=1 Tax=Phascolomyces articulosus TaxID=60185 RepID=A0AAD5K105_9FUNG|nr:hypothetical protein BDA99DRAFT_559476 [Phascolomyces articulosus]
MKHGVNPAVILLKRYKRTFSTHSSQMRIMRTLKDKHKIYLDRPLNHRELWDKKQHDALISMRCRRRNDWNKIAKRLCRTVKACQDKFQRIKSYYKEYDTRRQRISYINKKKW